jgi:hypothetical protein
LNSPFRRPVSNTLGDLEQCRLRPVDAYAAADWQSDRTPELP